MFDAGIPDLARAYQEEILREAEVRRSANFVKGPKPPPGARHLARLLAYAGRILISIGSRLLLKYGPVVAGTCCPCRDLPGHVPG